MPAHRRPKRFTIPMREIWDMQERLPRRSGKRADLLLENPRFPRRLRLPPAA